MHLMQEATTQSTNKNKLRAISQQWNDVNRRKFANPISKTTKALKATESVAFKKIASIFNTLYLDFEVARIAVSQNGLSIAYVSQDNQNNFDIAMAAVKQKGLALRFASHELRNQREIVNAAVKQFGMAILLSNKAFQQDRKIALAAISQTADAVSCISPTLLEDKAFMLTALKQNSQLLE
jgi:hypothetical protein